MHTLLNAWLLTWEGTSGPAVDPQRKIIAILDARKSEVFIEQLVDVLYHRSSKSAFGMASTANKGSQRRKQYKHLNTYPSQILYGYWPCIFARRVENLSVECDIEKNLEHLRWTEPSVIGNAKIGSGVDELVPKKLTGHVRTIGPLSHGGL
jgi:hypothetical protein